jgi:hypothetical protein
MVPPYRLEGQLRGTQAELKAKIAYRAASVLERKLSKAKVIVQQLSAMRTIEEWNGGDLVSFGKPLWQILRADASYTSLERRLHWIERSASRATMSVRGVYTPGDLPPLSIDGRGGGID